MLSTIFIFGIAAFTISSIYFYMKGKGRDSLNTSFLVSFVTLISYVLMWQGKLTVVTEGGEPIYWSRWLFYGLSCALLMFEIAKLKKIGGERMAELVYLTVIVMFTGFLAAHDLSMVRWIYFVISSVAYVILAAKVLAVDAQKTKWVSTYIFLGWSVFPIVFLLAPTGIGLIGAAIAELLYLALDLFTKIIFNIQLNNAS